MTYLGRRLAQAAAPYLALGVVVTGLGFMLGCAAQSTTAPTTPPSPQQSFQQPVLNATKLLADAANTAVKTVIGLRNNGTISNQDAAYVENYSVAAAKLADAITNELQSADTIAIQQTKILALVQSAAFPAIPGTPSQSIASIIQSMSSLVVQIRMQVGG